jgi:hypothetical protein
MDKNEFVDAIKVIEASALDGLEKGLISPPGRKPSADLMAVSTFYNGLNDEGRAILMKLAKLASGQATNNMLSIIDGNVAIESTPDKGDLELYFCKGGARVRLNPPEGETLSEMFRHVEQ